MLMMELVDGTIVTCAVLSIAGECVCICYATVHCANETLELDTFFSLYSPK